MKFVLSCRIYSVPYLFFFSPDAKASPMGLTKTLHCSVSGRSISRLLRSGVYLSVSQVIRFISFCLLGKPGVCSSSFLLFFSCYFWFQSPKKRSKTCHFCPGNVISRTRFLDWINRKGERPSVAAPADTIAQDGIQVICSGVRSRSAF